jgi:cell division protein FtsZ
MFEDIISAAKNKEASSSQDAPQAKPDDVDTNESVRISVIGVGGAGCNCINRMMKKGLKTAQAVAVNTDARHLQVVAAHKKILIGKNITKGLGAGGSPDVSRKCAESDAEMLKKEIGENELVFVCAGMGGGTGTGASPVIARLAKEQGAIVIGMVTYPFALERSRLKTAQAGIRELASVADTVVVIDNNRLLGYAPNLPINQAFDLVDTITSNAVMGITDTIMIQSMMNIDFADVRSIMQNGGVAFISIGEASGHTRVDDCIKNALAHPLLDVDYEGAKGALIHIECGPDLSLGDAHKIYAGVASQFDDNANVKIGARMNPDMQNSVKVTSIVVGVKSPSIFGKVEDKGGLDFMDDL